MKDFIIHDKKWILIADLHLNKDNYSAKEISLIDELQQVDAEYGIIVVGDFLSPGFSFNKCFIYHSLLMKELLKHKIVFLIGNNDPFISNYRRVIYDDYQNSDVIIEHGDGRPRLLNAFLNLFKREFAHDNRNVMKRRFKAAKKLHKYKNNNHIIAHYHAYIATKDGVAIPDWKVYLLEELLKL